VSIGVISLILRISVQYLEYSALASSRVQGVDAGLRLTAFSLGSVRTPYLRGLLLSGAMTRLPSASRLTPSQPVQVCMGIVGHARRILDQQPEILLLR
jgi:hypothetical protein